MTPKKWLAVSALALLPFAAHAQNAPQQPDPLDANAPVQASTYQSEFRNYQTVGDQTASPEKVWRAANDEMATLGGHAGHMKNMDDEAAVPPSPNAAGSSPAEHAPASSQKAPMDHSKHH